MRDQIKLVVFMLCVLFTPTIYAMSECADEMYTFLNQLDTANHDKAYWTKAKTDAAFICSSCKKPAQCKKYLNSVNKDTSKFEILGMLNRITNDNELSHEELHDNLDHTGPDLDDHANDETQIAL